MSEESVRFDRAAGFYDATRGYPPGVAERVAALLCETGALGRGHRVLEVGIGTGRIALPVSRRGPRVVGVDLSRPMLEQLRAHRGDEDVIAALADATRLPFPDASFDAAVVVHVFHLVPRWRDVLSELARVLREGAPLLSGGDEPGLVSSLWEELRSEGLDVPLRVVGAPRERRLECPADEGWRPRGAIRRLSFTTRATPRSFLERLASRSWSATWSLSDDELGRLVDAARERAREKLGDLDREIRVERGFAVQAYDAPNRET